MNKLREFRMARNLTINDLAAMMGVHYHTVYSWETGKSRPHECQIRRMALVLECLEDELGLVPYDRYHHAKKPDAVNKQASELYEQFYRLSLSEQRWIAAHLSPDPYYTTVKRLRDGKVTDSEAELVRKMMKECGGK